MTLVASLIALAATRGIAAPTTQANQPPATNMGAPTLLVPPSSIGIDLCLGEASGAYGSPMLAITLSTPRRDRDCTDLRLSKWAADLEPGHPALAYQIEADAGTERRCIPPRRPWWRPW